MYLDILFLLFLYLSYQDCCLRFGSYSAEHDLFHVTRIAEAQKSACMKYHANEGFREGGKSLGLVMKLRIRL